MQVEIDTHFLQRLNVLDYSFLLAQQNLQPDEQLQVLSLRTLIIRTKRSVSLSLSLSCLSLGCSSQYP